jgi:hypothetical protein
MAVIGVIILGLFAFGKLFTSTPEEATSTVDYLGVREQAQAATDLPLLAPEQLPAGWRATSARFEPGPDGTGGSWHLGVLTSDEEYLGLEQTPVALDEAADRWAEDSEEAGSSDVAGRVWSVRAGPGDRIAYLTRTGDRTIVVTGTVAQDELESYITSLSVSDSAPEPSPAAD